MLTTLKIKKKSNKINTASQNEAFIIAIEGIRAKRAYIGFWADFHCLQDRANFWQTDLF